MKTIKYWMKEIWLEIKYYFRKSDPELACAIKGMTRELLLTKPMERFYERLDKK